jgi:hypothetical protein
MFHEARSLRLLTYVLQKFGLARSEHNLVSSNRVKKVLNNTAPSEARRIFNEARANQAKRIEMNNDFSVLDVAIMSVAISRTSSLETFQKGACGGGCEN